MFVTSCAALVGIALAAFGVWYGIGEYRSRCRMRAHAQEAWDEVDEARRERNELRWRNRDLLAAAKRAREALKWTVEDDDPSPCPYCAIQGFGGDLCRAHAALRELDEACTEYVSETDKPRPMEISR
jgi:hypothetical protein